MAIPTKPKTSRCLPVVSVNHSNIKALGFGCVSSVDAEYAVSWPNVSDQTPRTQDVASTTDGLERLSASVLFVFGCLFRMSVMGLWRGRCWIVAR